MLPIVTIKPFSKIITGIRELKNLFIMNRFLIILAFLLLFTTFIRAQNDLAQTTNYKSKEYYVRSGLGYALSQGGETYSPWNGILSGSTTNPLSSHNYDFSIDKVSFSEGLHGYGAIGYMLNKNLGIELAADFGIYNKEYDYIGNNISSTLPTGTTLTIKNTQKAHYPLIIIPSIMLQTAGDVWNIYTRIGIALPAITGIDIHEEHLYQGPGGADVYDYTEFLKEKFSIGYSAATGISYLCSANIKVWAEFSMLSLTVYADELDYYGATHNGANYYSNLPRTIIPFRTNGNASTEFITYAVPYSNVALNVGLSWSFHMHRQKTQNKIHYSQ